MKFYVATALIICALLFPSFGHTFQSGDIYLRSLEGDVQVRTEDTTEWLPASINMPLLDGDQIWIPDNGRAELMLKNGTIVRLDRNSYLEILTSEERRPQLYLAAGRAYTNTRLKTDDAITFETPTVSFRAYGRSVFGIDVSENEDSTLSVFQGEVYVDRDTGDTRINAGDKAVFYKNTEYPRLTRIDPLDQWELWNRRKDQEFAAASSRPATAYLPDELSAYYTDFERNGKWVYDQEYGYVWTPTVITVKDWSPYRVGRWVWMRGDYVWISYEPWGWAPHHYGRWAFVNHRGWCWIPPARGAVHWGPGFVGWVHTPTYISWVPLAPRETYYGHGDYGPHSVNILNVAINTIIQNVVYRNIYVNNAVTTLHRDAFMTGRPAQRVTRENPFLRNKRPMAAPDIKPQRPAFMPIVKDIPQAKRPPQNIVNRVLEEKKKTNRFEQPQRRGNVPAVPMGSTPWIGQTDDRKLAVPKSQNDTEVRGPGEIKKNIPPQNTIKKIGPQQTNPVRPAIIPEKKIETPEKKITDQEKSPGISVKEQPPTANITQPQKPGPSIKERPLPSTRSIPSTVVTPPQPRDQTPTFKPQVPIEGPRKPNEFIGNNPSQNIKEAPPRQAPVAPAPAPVVPPAPPVPSAIVPEKKIEAPKRNVDAVTTRPSIRSETPQPQAPKTIENIKPPSLPVSNIQPAKVQPQPPLQKKEDTQPVQIDRPGARTDPVEKTVPEQNKRDFNKENRTDMRQRR